ncbi:MAG: 30S ribosomal protein S6 [Candidatus Acidiferrales bacterium]
MEERLYELIFICRPDTPEADVDKVIATLEHTVTEKGAKIEKTEKWGRKRMAYRVQRLREGFYVFMVLRSSHGEVVKELERRLKVADPVMKYITVRVDEELKRQDKLKRHREKRAARRPRKTVPAAYPPAGPAAAPAAAGGSEPAAAS